MMGNIIKISRNIISSLPRELKEFGFDIQMKRSEMGKNEKFIRQLLWPILKIIEGIISLYITALILPLLLILWLANEVIRVIIVGPLLSLRYGDKIKLVSAGEDNIWSFRKSGNSRNILMLTIFGNQIDLKEYQQNFSRRVLDYTDKDGRKLYRKLMKIYTQKCGYGCWKKDEHFDIENHIKVLNIPQNIVQQKRDFVTESDLAGLLSECTKDMSMEHPQWEEIIIPKFVYDRDVIVTNEGLRCDTSTKFKSAKIFRFSHTYMEGLSAIVMLKTCMVDGPFDCSMEPLAPLNISLWERITQFLTLVCFGATKMIGNIFMELNSDSRFLTPKFSHKISHDWSEPIEMKMINMIQKEMDCSAAEILTCALGGALRSVSEEFCKKPQWLIFRDSFEDSVLVGLPKFIIPYPNESPMNRFGVIGLNVNTSSISSTLDRLKLTKESFQRTVRGSPVPLLNYWIMKFVGRFPSIVIQKLLKNAGAPVVFSNIPNIKNKVKLMGQLEIEEFAGWMPMLTDTGIGVATAKYGENMRLCGVTETGCLCPQELHFLLKSMRNEVLMMAQECSCK